MRHEKLSTTPQSTYHSTLDSQITHFAFERSYHIPSLKNEQTKLIGNKEKKNAYGKLTDGEEKYTFLKSKIHLRCFLSFSVKKLEISVVGLCSTFHGA